MGLVSIYIGACQWGFRWASCWSGVGWVGLLERGLVRQVTDRVGLGFG